jgi:hypothetical protein
MPGVKGISRDFDTGQRITKQYPGCLRHGASQVIGAQSGAGILPCLPILVRSDYSHELLE